MNGSSGTGTPRGTPPMSSTRSSSPTRAASSGSPDQKQRDVHMLFHVGEAGHQGRLRLPGTLAPAAPPRPSPPLPPFIFSPCPPPPPPPRGGPPRPAPPAGGPPPPSGPAPYTKAAPGGPGGSVIKRSRP